MRNRIAFAAVLVLTIASTRQAHACWDGYTATTDRVSIGAPGDSVWSPLRVKDAATWITRVEALLPPDTHAEVFFDLVTVCRPTAQGRCDDQFGMTKVDTANLGTVFDGVSRVLHASKAQVAKARSLRAAPVTVQVFAAHDRARADAVAQRLNDDRIGEHGFIDAGGFPSSNGTAHVLHERDARGARIHRVVVGAFLRATDAVDTLADVATRGGLSGFVRPL